MPNHISKYIIIFFISFFNCKKSDTISVSGDLKNLSNGKIELINVYPWTVLDSTEVVNGKFKFILDKKKYPEPTLVKIISYNKHKEPNVFVFPTNQKIQNHPMGMDVFLLEDGIEISGKLEALRWGSKVNKPIKVGPQTQVMFNDSIGFSRLTKISKIKEAINEHPYSFYYLYELGKRVASFNNEQFLDLFEAFDYDVQNSNTGRELKEYILSRQSKKLDQTTTALNISTKPQKIISSTTSLNMIILWASWCGPCRKEIPELKLLYQKYKNSSNFNMVSISLDENTAFWHKAMLQEKMPWTQLLLTGESKLYSKELFSFDGSIPTTLFVDQKGNILKKIIGYDEKNNMELYKTIEEFMDK